MYALCENVDDLFNKHNSIRQDSAYILINSEVQRNVMDYDSLYKIISRNFLFNVTPNRSRSVFLVLDPFTSHIYTQGRIKSVIVLKKYKILSENAHLVFYRTSISSREIIGFPYKKIEINLSKINSFWQIIGVTESGSKFLKIVD